MSQSRFSIVLVGVSALLRRPLVSRLRPADGDRSPWVIFAARGDAPLRRWPSVSRAAARWVGSSAFRFGDGRRAVGLRAHGFRFSARTASGLPLGGLVLPPPASGLPSASWPSGSRLPLSACTASGLPSASWFFCLPFRKLPLGGLAFGFTASAFRHAPLRGCCSAGWPSGSRLPLFGMRRSAPPCRRREDRRSTPTRHLFHFKTLISTC